MYTIIDTIEHRSSFFRDQPDMPQKEGLLAVLDPDQVRAPFPKVIRVKISKPDGSSLMLEVNEILIGGEGVVALFFCPRERVEIPRGSVVELVN
jgi:hypothetical protein